MSLEIRIYRPEGSRISVTLPDNIPLRRLLPALVTKLDLPEFNEQEQLLSYHLVLEGSGERLPLDKTLAEVNVAAGSSFYLEAIPNARIEQLPTIRLTASSTKESQGNVDVPLAAAPQRVRERRNWDKKAWLVFLTFVLVNALPRMANHLFQTIQQEPLHPSHQSEESANDSAIASLPPGFGGSDDELIVPNQPYLLGYYEPAGGFEPKPRELTAVGDHLFFTAYSLNNGRTELLKSDGSRAGTTRVYRNITGGVLSELAASEERLFFRKVSSSEYMLLYSDGSRAVYNTVPPSAGSSPPVHINGVDIYYREPANGSSELWFVTADVSSTKVLTTVTPHENWYDDHAIAGDTLYFSGYTPADGWELWRSDGTITGTMMVTALNMPGSTLSNFTNLNGTLFFRMTPEGEKRASLWRSDGTATGTSRVRVNSCTARVRQLHVSGDWLYFAAGNGNSGWNLWRLNGSADGAELVHESSSGWIQAADPQFTSMNGLIYFVRFDGYGRELWRSDGTATGTYRITDVNAGSESSDPKELTVVGDTLFFTAYSKLFGRELWRSDGTETGTEMVVDMIGWAGSSAPESLTAVGNKLFFVTTSNEIEARGLWVIEVGP